jgi:uncharacterized OsmC-like protein
VASNIDGKERTMALRVDPGLKEIVRKQLSERSAPSNEPPRPVTNVKSRALFDLQFRATVEGHEFISDEREEGGGHDAGPAPLRYFLGGIMMCHQVWTVKSSTVMDVTLEELEGEISGYVERGAPAGAATDEGRGFARVTFTVSVQSPNTPDEVIKVVTEASRRCAAFVTVARSTPIDVTIVHNGKTIEERKYGPKS